MRKRFSRPASSGSRHPVLRPTQGTHREIWIWPGMGSAPLKRMICSIECQCSRGRPSCIPALDTGGRSRVVSAHETIPVKALSVQFCFNCFLIAIMWTSIARPPNGLRRPTRRTTRGAMVRPGHRPSARPDRPERWDGPAVPRIALGRHREPVDAGVHETDKELPQQSVRWTAKSLVLVRQRQVAATVARQQTMHARHGCQPRVS